LQETVEAFLHYVYRDALPPQLSAPQTAELAHAAAFFNAQVLRGSAFLNIAEKAAADLRLSNSLKTAEPVHRRCCDLSTIFL
jgi:hypothetical protein